MKISRLNITVEPLREMLYQWDTLIRRVKDKSGKKLVGLMCDMLPVEIIASFDLVPVKIPSFWIDRIIGCGGSGEEYSEIVELFDFVILSDKCCNKRELKTGNNTSLLKFKSIDGFGEDAAVKLHRSIDEILLKMGVNGTKGIIQENLAKSADLYNQIRRIVRGICAVRNEKPDLLSNDDLMTIFEAVQSIPLKMIKDHITMLLDKMNREESSCSNELISSMVYGGVQVGGELLDEIEESGCLIKEDDLCNGRRQFDLSHNISSEYLYYEILNSFTYRPLCPSIRPGQERFDSLYKLLKNYGIEMVILLKDHKCIARNEQINFIRKKLMRLGIDPVAADIKSAPEAVKEYVSSLRSIKKYNRSI